MAVTETKPSMKRTAEKTSMEEEELLALNLPMVSVQVHRPHMHVPHMDTSWAGRAMEMGRSALPPPERLVYYGGLGALAIIGAIEWPIAAAIGVGTAIASRAVGKPTGPRQALSAMKEAAAAMQEATSGAKRAPSAEKRTPSATRRTPSATASKSSSKRSRKQA